MDLISLFPALGFPILRSVGGWLENSLKDGKIDKFEWAKLGETIVRIGIITVCGYYGLTLVGVEIPVVAASAGAVVLDFILKALKKK